MSKRVYIYIYIYTKCTFCSDLQFHIGSLSLYNNDCKTGEIIFICD